MKNKMTLEEAKAQLQAAISGHNAKYWAYTDAVKTILDVLNQEPVVVKLPDAELTKEVISKISDTIDDAARIYGDHWDSSLVGGEANYHAITSEYTQDIVVKTTDDSLHSSWLCDYLEAVSPANIRLLLLALNPLSTSSPPAQAAMSDSKQVDELTMLVKRLAHSLKNANPDSKLSANAMDYLSRNGLISVGDILRCEPVSNPYKLPGTQFKPVADLYGITPPTGSEMIFTFDAVEACDLIDGGSSCQQYVELERFQQAVFGNYPVIPDGWKLVPEIAFPSQFAAGKKAFDSAGINKIDAVYKAMVLSAPQPPAPEA